MKITAWRITQTVHADDAFSGLGAWLEGARWNDKGVYMVYTAETISLAALEMIVHLPEDALLYNVYVRIPVVFDSKQVIALKPSELPSDWKLSPPPESTQKIGSDWAKAKKSLALKVPSSVIPDEFNYLINPLHPDATTLKIGKAETFYFDTRIKR
ncbi:MAG: RES family NAD+ phosphorylase [Desulfobacteraceae bacterium]|nr:RES family NAD+ phosphorylase [Desulfobacteraceae bacterium]